MIGMGLVNSGQFTVIERERLDAVLEEHGFQPSGQVNPAAGSLYIDQGENRGVRVGQRFEVHRVVDEVVNAAGDVLDQITDRVGVIEVTRVLSRSAICTVVEGEAGEGDMLRAVE